MTGGAGRSHAITDYMARSGDVAFWADIMVAMETGGPVTYMGVWKGFIVLGQD